MTTSDFFLNTFHREHTVRSSAPGRIEFIGNHTDYNGGKVMGAAIDRGIDAAFAPRNDRKVRLASKGAPLVELTLDAIARQEGPSQWANYPLGMLVVMIQAGLKVTSGFDIAFTSTLPVGAGLSSSAALELATAYALMGGFNGSFDRADLARLGRKAENEFVGVPCGILDQGVSAHGVKDGLVRIDCRTETFSTAPIPHGTAFWIFNSHKKHALIGSLYNDRHAECMEAARILSKNKPGSSILSDFTTAELDAYKDQLSDVLYRRARHITGENERVQGVVDALESKDLSTVGRLLFESHDSSRDLFENSTPELDALVDILKNTPNVYGARLTGGGFGGAVMAFTSGNFTGEQATRVADAYAARFNDRPDLLQCHAAQGARLL